MEKVMLKVRYFVFVVSIVALSLTGTKPSPGQASSSAAVPFTRQLGTVKAISDKSISMTTDAGKVVALFVPENAQIVQLAPGSTDLKSAQTIVLGDIGVGDRILVTGRPGDTPDAFTASRVILMKSGDIAQKHVAEQADWQKRGMGGIAGSVDPIGRAISLAAGARKVLVRTTPKTIFRRYAVDSIKFEDAKPGTLSQINAGDQIEVRGAKSDDGATMQAEEIVSGSFRNLSGTIASIDSETGTVTLKDLSTKRMITVIVTPNSDLRKLPTDLGAGFAARERAGVPASGTLPSVAVRPETGRQGRARIDGRPSAASGNPSPGTTASHANASGARGSTGTSGAEPAVPGDARSASMDLSKMLTRLPSTALKDLHAGDAIMVVASQSHTGSDSVTAVTLLAGVESILAATASGGQAMTLSPWSVGGGAPEGGGGGAP